MKYSVSSYSFYGMIESGKMSRLDCPAKAKELGFDAIEFAEPVREDVFSPEYARQLRAKCDEAGIEVSNYVFGADFLNGSEGDIEAEIDRVIKKLDVAEILGTKIIRHDATIGYSGKDYKSFDEVLPTLAYACRKITEAAAARGIKTMVENHGYFCQDSERMEKLVRAVDHENFGLLCDMGNFMCADEDPEKAFARVAPYAFYVHAKDFLWKSGNGINPGGGFFPTRAGNFIRGTVVGHGVVPVKQCLSIVKRTGFDGTIAIEFEGLEDNFVALAIGLKNLKDYVELVSV